MAGQCARTENAIERAVVLGDGCPRTCRDRARFPAAAPSLPGALQTSVTDTKRQLILRTWEESRPDYKLAALNLNIHPNSQLRLVRTLGLREVLK